MCTVRNTTCINAAAVRTKSRKKTYCSFECSSSPSGQGFPVCLTALIGWLLSRVLKPAGQLDWRHWSTLNYGQLQPTWLICPSQKISACLLSDSSFSLKKMQLNTTNKQSDIIRVSVYSKWGNKSAPLHCLLMRREVLRLSWYTVKYGHLNTSFRLTDKSDNSVKKRRKKHTNSTYCNLYLMICI